MHNLLSVFVFSVLTLINCVSLPALAMRVNGLELAVTVSGKGDTVLLFESGFGRSGNVWEAVIAQLPPNVTAVRYARAGTGQSEDRAMASGLEQHVNDLTALSQLVAQGKQLILIGHSYGGLVATEFARRYPERLTALVLIDPTVAQQRNWFKQADANAVAAEDALFQRMLPEKLQRQLMQLNQELELAATTVSPLPSELKTILLTSTRTEPEPVAFVETATGKAIWLKLHQALFADVRHGNHQRLNTVGHNIMQDDPQSVLNALKSLL